MTASSFDSELKQLVDILVREYGELIFKSWSTHPYPIQSLQFAEIIACFEILKYPVSSGAYEAIISEPVVLPEQSLPRFGIANTTIGSDRQTLRTLRGELSQIHPYTQKFIKIFKENELLVQGLSQLIDTFDKTHSAPLHARLIIRPGELGEGYLTFTGGLHWQRLHKEM
jgi:hypothetical protein